MMVLGNVSAISRWLVEGLGAEEAFVNLEGVLLQLLLLKKFLEVKLPDSDLVCLVHCPDGLELLFVEERVQICADCFAAVFVLRRLLRKDHGGVDVS